MEGFILTAALTQEDIDRLTAEALLLGYPDLMAYVKVQVLEVLRAHGLEPTEDQVNIDLKAIR